MGRVRPDPPILGAAHCWYSPALEKLTPAYLAGKQKPLFVTTASVYRSDGSKLRGQPSPERIS
jgi:hypothetical protein